MIDAILSGIYGIVRIRVSFEGFRIDNLIRELAANNKGILKIKSVSFLGFGKIQD